MKGGVRIDGLNRVVRDLQSLGVEVDDLKTVFGKIADAAADRAAAAAPRKSGRLAASIRGNRAKNKAVVTAGRARVPYAGAINYGWRKRGIEPAEFMQESDRQMRQVAPRMLEQGIDKIIKGKGL
ncbi:MAG: hypothetical protein ACRCY8_06675 [Dermatophilaceae bacterium]